MKLLITGDIHFGYQDKLDDTTWAFRTMFSYCINNGIKHLVILGDLVHDRSFLTHDVSNRIYEILNEAKSLGIDIIIFPGNHDMFNRNNWNINAIKPFKDLVTLIEDVSWFMLGGTKFYVVPFIESEKLYMKVLNTINEEATENDVLLTHIGVNGAIYNHCFLSANWSHVTFKGTKFKKVYAGHFHNYQNIDKLYYPGSPLPFRFDEGLVPHGFIVYDPENDNHSFVNIYDVKIDSHGKPPPDYITVTSDNIDSIADSIKDNMVRVQINDGDDQEEIKQKILNLGAEKVIITKNKGKKIELSQVGSALKSDQIFEDWVGFDKPEHLNIDLLINLEKSIRQDTRYREDLND